MHVGLDAGGDRLACGIAGGASEGRDEHHLGPRPRPLQLPHEALQLAGAHVVGGVTSEQPQARAQQPVEGEHEAARAAPDLVAELMQRGLSGSRILRVYAAPTWTRTKSGSSLSRE